MFLLEPARTQFDLRWRMFGTDVRVHPMFWLLSAIMGWNLIERGLEYVLIWVAVIFVSILFHEFGHVFMGRLFGSHGHIVLYSFGGLAIGSNHLSSRWQRIAVCFAGPLADFILGALAWLCLVYVLPRPEIEPTRQMELLQFALATTVFVNLFWGLLNLAPIWPLDGGQISRDLFLWVSPRKGLSLSLGLSFLLAALLAINSLLGHYNKPHVPYVVLGIFGTLMFALLALESFQLLQQASAAERRPYRYEDDEVPWERRDDHWE